MIERFRVAVPDAVLADLGERLARTRWPDDFANEDWRYGVNGAYLRELVEYWRTGYDWRAVEREMNMYRHFRVQVDGVPVHFLRVPGRGPNPVPLILSHGWPWSFWDYHKVIGPLSDPGAYGGDPADAFEIILPSMPGFGFSTPLIQPGINCWRTADLWRKLMVEVLGFRRFAAQGGDWGGLTTLQLGHKYAADLIGIHVTLVVPLTLFNNERPWDITGGQGVPLDLPAAERERLLAIQRGFASHVAVHVLDPQTLAYGMHDSPAGLLAWLLERRRAWSDCGGDVERRFSRDELITLAMLYWVTGSFVTSVRYYAEAARHPWQPSHDREPRVQAPAGVSLFGGDPAAALADDFPRWINVHHVARHPVGGHFAPAEEPDRLVQDIRATFRELRARS